MKSILKNSNGNAVSTNGKLFTVNANYTDQIKQALIDKGVATEDTPNSELAGKIEGIVLLQALIDSQGDNTGYSLFKYSGFENMDFLKKLDLSNIKTGYEMFYSCENLISIPDNLITNQLKYTDYMFWNCNQLIKVPLGLNLKNCSSAYCMFQSCIKITEIGDLGDTSSVNNTGNMCNGCSNLKSFGPFNMIKVNSNSNMFRGCRELENLTLLNIKGTLTIGVGDGSSQYSHYGFKLSLESLINTIKELVNTGASKTLTIGSANLDKITNVYVRRTTEGDIPTCLSDNSNIDLAKAPCEVCNADDEGAMSIIAYANMKNWTLA